MEKAESITNENLLKSDDSDIKVIDHTIFHNTTYSITTWVNLCLFLYREVLLSCIFNIKYSN